MQVNAELVSLAPPFREHCNLICALHVTHHTPSQPAPPIPVRIRRPSIIFFIKFTSYVEQDSSIKLGDGRYDSLCSPNIPNCTLFNKNSLHFAFPSPAKLYIQTIKYTMIMHDVKTFVQVLI